MILKYKWVGAIVAMLLASCGAERYETLESVCSVSNSPKVNRCNKPITKADIHTDFDAPDYYPIARCLPGKDPRECEQRCLDLNEPNKEPLCGFDREHHECSLESAMWSQGHKKCFQQNPSLTSFFYQQCMIDTFGTNALRSHYCNDVKNLGSDWFE